MGSPSGTCCRHPCIFLWRMLYVSCICVRVTVPSQCNECTLNFKLWIHVYTYIHRIRYTGVRIYTLPRASATFALCGTCMQSADCLLKNRGTNACTILQNAVLPVTYGSWCCFGSGNRLLQPMAVPPDIPSCQRK